MITFIKIQNFTLIEHLELTPAAGLTVITGESGAGKSILFDALNYLLGARAEATAVRVNASECDLTAQFDVAKLPVASVWLEQHALQAEEDCILRRIITAEGRSKAFINGHPVTLTMVRDLAQRLVMVHGQQGHQALLQTATQLHYLDRFAQQSKELQAVEQAYDAWSETQKKVNHLTQAMTERAARMDFLQFQLQELNQLAVADQEYEQLEQECKKLANVESVQQHYQALLSLLSDTDTSNVAQQLHVALNHLDTLTQMDASLEETLTLLQQASIQVEESISTLRANADKAVVDPERLHTVSQRLAEIQTLARKHRVNPHALWPLQEKFQHEYDTLNKAEEHTACLQQQLQQHAQQYEQQARKLSQGRQRAAKALAKEVTQHLQILGMPKAKFSVHCIGVQDYHRHGQDHIQFVLSANPGQPMEAINKVASGGELSRISLAIHAVMMCFTAPPLLLFDEVDVGVSGATAEVVGRLLQQLAQKAQVLCVTHQPQVAALGDQHWRVNKQQKANTTTAEVTLLDKAQRIEELARILGGIKISAQTFAHARSLLES